MASRPALARRGVVALGLTVAGATLAACGGGGNSPSAATTSTAPPVATTSVTAATTSVPPTTVPRPTVPTATAPPTTVSRTASTVARPASPTPGATTTPGTAAGPATTAATVPPVKANYTIDPGDGGRYQPAVDPANFVDGIDNPYLPFTPGSRWVYEGTDANDPEHIEVVVTPERRDVMGISAVVVRDTVTVKGEVIEDTSDWYAQDRQGNVWYLGEDTAEYENGRVVSRKGAWEAGVDGALPGIIMKAAPAVGQAYRQEFFVDEAEDNAEVVAVDASATVAYGAADRLVVTREWTRLKPEAVEDKYYAPGVGLILELKVAGGAGRVELVEFTPGA